MKREIKEVLEESLTRIGFVRKSSTWRRSCIEVTQVVNLQKSNYDDTYFLNIAFWIDLLGDPGPAVREEQCHVRGRAMPDLLGEQSRVEEFLSVRSRLEKGERLEGLRAALQDEVLPLLERMNCIEGIRAEIRRSKPWAVRRTAHELLDYSPGA